MADPPRTRWLDIEGLAAYISVRPDAVTRLVKAGRLPEPSRELGPRQPRWDRLAIDALFEGGAAEADVERAMEAAVQDILARGPKRRKRDHPR